MNTAVTDWSEAMMTSLVGAMALFFAAIPRVIGFMLIILIGWFVATLLPIAFFLMLLNFEQATEIKIC